MILSWMRFGARDAHARRFDYDLAAICEDIRERQSEYGHSRVVRLRRERQPVAIHGRRSAILDKNTNDSVAERAVASETGS
uniref:Uncharacterized protein n=1 Tax=Candidatus Kentrum sp. LPFa TaxID=2126335 RepID=A0A450XX24_9GAMM|nr:MAG: hypothetical protein BECKLPF1236A_GA0070988_102246 [Candidatus Kentron sp. LPFa]VFK33823.1 MAG: hypothetical protein BECKLPF1236C_GA0070990_102266 [Candidatus Kentron sp. LPFa]